MILRKLNSSRFSEVLPLWIGTTVVVIGGGPSLTVEQVEHVRVAHFNGRVHCIAVNDAYLLAPWADVQYAADAAWHRWHSDGVERPGLTASEVRDRWHGFKGQKCSIENAYGDTVDYEDVHMLRNKNYPYHGWGISQDPKALVTGRNSGFQALNLATLSGSRRVLLLGFDGKEGEKSHWFGQHPKSTPVSAYEQYRQAMSLAERELQDIGAEVLNCSPDSAINTFRKVNLEEALC